MRGRVEMDPRKRRHAKRSIERAAALIRNAQYPLALIFAAMIFVFCLAVGVYLRVLGMIAAIAIARGLADPMNEVSESVTRGSRVPVVIGLVMSSSFVALIAFISVVAMLRASGRDLEEPLDAIMLAIGLLLIFGIAGCAVYTFSAALIAFRRLALDQRISQGFAVIAANAPEPTQAHHGTLPPRPNLQRTHRAAPSEGAP